MPIVFTNRPTREIMFCPSDCKYSNPWFSAEVADWIDLLDDLSCSLLLAIKHETNTLFRSRQLLILKYLTEESQKKECSIQQR